MTHDFVRHDITREQRIRDAAVRWVRARTFDGELALTREDILDFHFEGAPFRLQDLTKGIRRPAGFSAALSITTSFKPKKKFETYADRLGTDGLWHYSWERGGAAVPSNQGLLAAFRSGVPLIGFLGIGGKPAQFHVIAPLRVTDWIPELEQVVLAPSEYGDSLAEQQENAIQSERLLRRYLIRETKVRVHQPYFRSLILRAYESRCAVCDLGHTELLDAAHIVPDAEAGQPVVPNGLALCKLHHAAYDNRLIGIDGDYTVHVKPALLAETDGPMLEHGIKQMHGHRLRHLPRARSERPDRAALDASFQKFASDDLAHAGSQLASSP